MLASRHVASRSPSRAVGIREESGVMKHLNRPYTIWGQTRYFVLCVAVRKNIRKMQRDRTKLASADSLLGGRTSREAGHNGTKKSLKSNLKRFFIRKEMALT